MCRQNMAKAFFLGFLLIVFLMQPVMAEKFQISVFGGVNHVFPYGSEEDYAPGLNDFPGTPAHASPNFGAAFALYLTKNLALELDWRYALSSGSGH